MFAGAGAHHHNGMAKCAIGMITNMACTMMLYTAIHWPEATDATQWLMAVIHASYLYNHMPRLKIGISPVDLFTKTRWEQKKFHDCHVWVAQCVLDKTLGDGKKIPKWKPQSKQEEWKKAMAQEIQQLEDHGTWEQVPISDAKTKILPLTWVLHCKQSPEGKIKKLKACICMPGDLQEGDYVTFTPVISWISIHIILVLSITFHWTTCCIDSANAFVQATAIKRTHLD
jgi:hypothetical protein